MKDKAKQYFEAFNNQDISKLEELYSDDIRLRDWLTEARGRDDVIISNRNAPRIGACCEACREGGALLRFCFFPGSRPPPPRRLTLD